MTPTVSLLATLMSAPSMISDTPRSSLDFARDSYRAISLYAPNREPCAVDLSDNTNLWGVPPAAERAVREAGLASFTRYPSLYAPALKGALAQYLGVPPEMIVTGCGSDDVLDSAIRALAEPGERVAHPEPSFAMVPIFARMNALEPVAVPLTASFDLDAEAMLATGARIIYLCSPNNPTGRVAPRKWVETLLKAAEGAKGPLVVLDEAYADFAPESESFIRDAPFTPNLLVTRTLSKAFGLAGFRVGFAVGTAAVAREVEKSRGPYKVNRLAEAAAVAALDDQDGWAARTTEQCVANRERLFVELERRGLRPVPSWGNFLLFPVPDGSAKAWNDALRARGVAVRPFPACADIGDAMRVTVAPWPLLERFLAAVDGVLADGAAPAPAGVR